MGFARRCAHGLALLMGALSRTPAPEGEPKPDYERPPSGRDSALVFGVLILLLAASYLLFGKEAAKGPNQIALIFSSVVAGLVAHKNGMRWEGVNQSIIDGVAAGLSAIFILLAVGALIGSWALSGTMAAMVYYGLDLLNPQYFYVSALALCAAIAVALGSSWTVIGTIGVGLMGVAANLGLSLEITAGAIVSGAFFGDRTSPLSDTLNLAAAVTGADLFRLIRASLWTSVPSFLLAAALFAALGSSSADQAAPALRNLSDHFNISPWAFLPLGAVFLLAVLRLPPFVTIFAGALLGGAVAAALNPGVALAFVDEPDLPAPVRIFKAVWLALSTGFVSRSGDAALDALLSRGGMAHMLNTVWLIMSALAFGAIVEHAGLVQRLVDPIAARARTIGGLIASTAAVCVGVNLATADQYMAVALPGRMFGPEYRKRGYAPVVLARALGDAGVATSALIPWNSCGAYIAATLAIPTFSFAGFAFFCLLSPLMTVAIGLLGLKMTRAEVKAQGAPQ
jgi:Na+:H+ antiporter, NhaC family